MRLLVTGAGGFLGRAIVRQALAGGHQVQALVRPGRGAALAGLPPAQCEIIQLDLADPAAAAGLAARLADLRAGQCDADTAVIHAAGLLAGDDARHLQQTVAPTRRLAAAMAHAGVRRLVLLSSLSVYGYTALPEGALLDETLPTEPHPERRDAYSRAKLMQETVALEAAQRTGLRVTALRAGALYGPGRLWTARLGAVKGGLGLRIGAAAALPLCYVEHCAAAALLAAGQDVACSDVHIDAAIPGAFEAINVVDDDQPSQARYAALLRRHGVLPRVALYLPWPLLRRAAAACALAAIPAPRLYARLPGLLRVESLHARFKPLRYSNCRLHDRLGWQPAWDCATAVARAAAMVTAAAQAAADTCGVRHGA